MSFILQSRKKLRVENRLGLHIAPAAMIVKLLTQYPNVSVLVRNSDEQVDARSVMGLIMLEARKNSELLFIAVEKENRQKKIASNLIDVAQKIIINNKIKDVHVSINDDNRVCQKIIENKGYVFMQTIVLYNKKMKLYVKCL